jgi:hypothetical protein
LYFVASAWIAVLPPDGSLKHFPISAPPASAAASAWSWRCRLCTHQLPMSTDSETSRIANGSSSAVSTITPPSSLRTCFTNTFRPR